MNREILFRGKRTDDGEWVKGFYVKTCNDFDRSKFYHWIYIGFVGVTINGLENVNFEVDPETVGQYTGLKDCNGKRIFEGDIVKFKLQDADEYRFAKILYGEFVDENDSQFYLGFYVVGMGCTFSIFNGKDEGYDFIGMCEVCGNVHDHPELLEEV